MWQESVWKQKRLSQVGPWGRAKNTRQVIRWKENKKQKCLPQGHEATLHWVPPASLDVEDGNRVGSALMISMANSTMIKTKKQKQFQFKRVQSFRVHLLHMQSYLQPWKLRCAKDNTLRLGFTLAAWIRYVPVTPRCILYIWYRSDSGCQCKPSLRFL